MSTPACYVTTMSFLPDYKPGNIIGTVQSVQSSENANHIHNGIQEFQFKLAIQHSPRI